MAFVPPVGPSGYKRMKARRPVRTKDGWLTMLPYSGNNWCAFFEAVGHPECIDEFSVRDPVARARNIDRIYDRMRDIAPSRTTAEWEELLLRIDVPHTGFAKLCEVMQQPHLKAVELFQELDHPSEGKIRQARPPARFSASPAGVQRLAPRLGEHTREVLREVGYGQAEIDGLVEKKAEGWGEGTGALTARHSPVPADRKVSVRLPHKNKSRARHDRCARPNERHVGVLHLP